MSLLPPPLYTQDRRVLTPPSGDGMVADGRGQLILFLLPSSLPQITSWLIQIGLLVVSGSSRLESWIVACRAMNPAFLRWSFAKSTSPPLSSSCLFAEIASTTHVLVLSYLFASLLLSYLPLSLSCVSLQSAHSLAFSVCERTGCLERGAISPLSTSCRYHLSPSCSCSCHHITLETTRADAMSLPP